MEKYLLDTNICIFLLRGKYNVDKKMDEVGLENCYTWMNLLHPYECCQLAKRLIFLPKKKHACVWLEHLRMTILIC